MTTLPTYDQVAALPVTTVRSVPEEFIDANGHMNIRHYLTLGAMGVAEEFQAAGMDEAYIRDRGMSVFTAEHHLRYLGELRLGDELTVRTRFVERSDKVLHAMAFVLDETHRRLALTFETTLVHVDIETRTSTAFPDDIVAAIDERLDAHADLGWDPPLSGVMGVRR